jgi:hypothetical protein
VRRTAWALVIAGSFLAVAAMPAQAGGTCKIVPSMCPPAAPGSGGGKVPEPASMTILGVGALAAGLAARRRRNKK